MGASPASTSLQAALFNLQEPSRMRVLKVISCEKHKILFLEMSQWGGVRPGTRNGKLHSVPRSRPRRGRVGHGYSVGSSARLILPK